MRICTRTGDDGTTGLPGAGRVFRDAARTVARVDLDELDAVRDAVRPFGPIDWLAAGPTAPSGRLRGAAGREPLL